MVSEKKYLTVCSLLLLSGKKFQNNNNNLENRTVYVKGKMDWLGFTRKKRYELRFGYELGRGAV